MVLTSQQLIQVNATIIAGLLILLTLQATASGGISFLFDLSVTREQIEMYENLMNDTNQDPVLFDAMKKRHAELKLDLAERELKFGKSSDNWLIELFYNPITTFTSAMVFFLIAIMWEIGPLSKHDDASKIGKILTYIGFMTMFVSVVVLILIPGI